MTDGSVKSKLTAIFGAITKAYKALKEGPEEAYQPVSGKEGGEHDNKAADQFDRGVKEFKKGNFWGAIDNFKWAARLVPGNGRYWSYLSLAYSKIEGRLKDAEEALLTAIKLEPFNADYHVNLGLIYLKAGAKMRAKSSFEKALEIEPGNEKAKKALRQAAGK